MDAPWRPRRGHAPPFAVHLLLSLVLALTVVAVVQFSLSDHALTRQVHAERLADLKGDAQALRAAHGSADAGEEPLDEVEEAIAVLAARPGTTSVALLDTAGRVVATSDPWASRDPDIASASIAAGRAPAHAGPAPDGDERSFEYATALQLSGDRYVVRVREDDSRLSARLASRRAWVASVLVVGATVALAVFYLVGGRALAARHRSALAAALVDGLTGLGNHRAFEDELEAALARAARSGRPLSLAVVDVDDFKAVNDRLGHHFGDRLLIELGAVLGDSRGGDRAFRLGGDEFALIFADVDGDQAASAMARRRVQAIERLSSATLSVGIATRRREDAALTRVALLERADAALYEAKRRGRNQLVAFDDIDAVSPIVSTDQVRAVQQLIHDREVSVAFQPIWDLEVNRVLGYEALARLPAGVGLSGPGEAFDVAEKLGIAAELDALCHVAVLRRASELPPETSLFLNVSAYTLAEDPAWPSWLRAAVVAAGLRPERVVVEVAQPRSGRLDAVVEQVARLRDDGFRIALDDVGSGEWRLDLLRSAPADFIKVGADVVAAAMSDACARGMLAAIVAFARSCGSFVIAEGIETEAMLSLVLSPDLVEASARRVHGGQGYLLGRPTARVEHAQVSEPAA